MLLGAVIERFAEKSPMAVAVRSALEYALTPDALDTIFEQIVGERNDRELLFSTCVNLMATVVCRIKPSVHAVYQADERIPVSIAARYARLSRISPEIGRALVRHTMERLEPVIRQMGGTTPNPLPGYRLKILDGNHLAHTQRRLKVLRNVAAGPLPGQTLVVLDPVLGLALDVICCEDGHSQERVMLDSILETVRPFDVWSADRNFCTTALLFGIKARGGFFVIRRHASTLSWERESDWVEHGRTDGGKLSEQTIHLQGTDGAELPVRRIRVTLDHPTEDGDKVLEILTNLPAEVASAAVVAGLYRSRWSVEGLFQVLTVVLKCALNTLGYPPAALFGFCVALACSNVYAAVKGALRRVHGADVVNESVSDYHVALEVSGVREGMAIAVPEETWAAISGWSVRTLADWLVSLATRAKLSRYKKGKRGPKKPKPRRTRFAKSKHIATARLLNGEQT
jgi:hypothetical protein